MRSNEERIAEVKRRIAEKEYKKRLRREWAAAVCCVAACLAVIAGVSLSMPDTVSRIEMGTSSGFFIQMTFHEHLINIVIRVPSTRLMNGICPFSQCHCSYTIVL